MTAAEPDELEHTRMTLGGHLQELRKRVSRSLAAVLVAFVVAWVFKEEILDRVMWPWRTAVHQINASSSTISASVPAAAPNGKSK